MTETSWLVLAAVVGIIGTCRMFLAMYATHWYGTRVERLKAITPGDTAKFHDVMYDPKPFAVRVSDWLEVHHV